MKKYLKIPPEIWLKIFENLTVRDLCQVMLVSRDWNEIGNTPKLWEDVWIMKRRVFLEGFPTLFAIPRFSKIKRLDLSRSWMKRNQWHNVLTQIVNSPPLDELNLSEADLNEVEIDLLGVAISNARNVNVSALHNLDWVPIFEKLATSDVIQEIDLSENFLPLIPKTLFIKTLSRLKKVQLNDSLVTGEQLRGLLEETRITNTKVAANMVCENINQIPLHLTTAFSKLYKTYLYLEDYTDFTPALWKSVLTSLDSSNIMEDLTIDGISINLVDVESNLLANSLSKLNTLKLSGVELTHEQWSKFFERLALSSLSDLSLRMVNLSSIPIKILAPALSLRSKLSLEYAVLTTDQWTQLLECCTKSASLEHVRFAHVNLSEVPVNLISQVINLSQSADISGTGLTQHQVSEILTNLTKSSSLREINLQGIDVSQVSSEILAKAVVSLVKVNLRKTKLTTKQCTALFATNLGPTKLRDLDLSNVNLSGVDGDLLSMSITRLRDVDLTCTWLTKNQVARFVQQVTKFTRLEYLKLQSATASLLTPEMKQNIQQNMRILIF